MKATSSNTACALGSPSRRTSAYCRFVSTHTEHSAEFSGPVAKGICFNGTSTYRDGINQPTKRPTTTRSITCSILLLVRAALSSMALFFAIWASNLLCNFISTSWQSWSFDSAASSSFCASSSLTSAMRRASSFGLTTCRHQSGVGAVARIITT